MINGLRMHNRLRLFHVKVIYLMMLHVDTDISLKNPHLLVQPNILILLIGACGQVSKGARSNHTNEVEVLGVSLSIANISVAQG